MLQKSEEFFDRTITNRKTDKVDSELKENPKLIYSRLYPLPKVQEEMLIICMEYLVLLGVREDFIGPEWEAIIFHNLHI